MIDKYILNLDYNLDMIEIRLVNQFIYFKINKLNYKDQLLRMN